MHVELLKQFNKLLKNGLFFLLRGSGRYMLPWQNQSLPSSARAELKLLADSLAVKAVPGLFLRNRMLLGFASLASHGADLQPSPVGAVSCPPCW